MSKVEGRGLIEGGGQLINFFGHQGGCLCKVGTKYSLMSFSYCWRREKIE